MGLQITAPGFTGGAIRSALVYPDGVKQTFNPNGTSAGLNVGTHTADPSAVSDGDLWYNSVDNALRARVNGVTLALGGGVTGSGTQNTIPKWGSGGGSLVDSRVGDDGISAAVTINAGISVNGGDGGDEIFFAENNSGNINSAIGDFNGGFNETYWRLDDSAKTIRSVAGTESSAIDGTAHTIVNTAATSISLLGAGNVLVVDTMGIALGGPSGTIVDSTGRISSYAASSPVDGELLIGRSSDGTFRKNSLTAGMGISITPSGGNITIARDNTGSGTILAIPVNNTVLATATGTVYSSPGYAGTPLAAATEGAVSFPSPRSGTLRNLYARTGTTAKVNTPATVITIRLNGADTAVALILTQTTSTTTSDTAHNVAVAAGDLITVSLVTTGVAAVSTSISGISFEID